MHSCHRSLATLTALFLVPAFAAPIVTAQDALSITVHVVDTSLRPIPNAVVLRTMSWRGRYSPENLLSGRQFPLAEVLDRGETGDDGKCVLRLPPASAYVYLPPRSVLWVRAPGHATRAIPIQRDAMPAGPMIRVVLAPRESVSVTKVLEAEEQPASGVLIRAIAIQCGDGVALLPDELIAESKTDARGVVRFDGLDGVTAVEIRHPRLGTQVATRVGDHGLEQIHLKPAPRMVLEVEGAEGLPPSAVAGQHLRVWTVPKRGRSAAPIGERQVMGFVEARFDAAGKIQCPALAVGVLHIERVGGADAKVLPEIKWGLKHMAAGTPLRLKLVQTRPVEGQVLDEKTSRGVSGVRVRVTTGGEIRHVTTGVSGRFVLRVYGKSALVSVDRCPARFLLGTSGFQTIKDPGAISIEPFKLQLGAVLRGRVVDRDTAVSGAFVVAEWKEKSRFGDRTRRRWAFSGADGRFQIHGVSPGVRPTLVGRSTAGRTHSVHVAATGETVLRLDATSAVRISGRVRTRDSVGVVGALVTVERQRVPTRRAIGGAKQEVTEILAATDAEGNFQCRAPAGPDYRVRVQAKGFAPTGSAWYRSSAKGIGIDVRMRRLVTLSGRVVMGGTPVAGATVSCPTRDLSCRTDDAGRFQLQGMPEGRALLVVQEGGKVYVRRHESGAIDLSTPRTRRQAPTLTLKNRLALAKNVLQPSILELRKTGKIDSDLRLWQLLGEVDPAATFARIETRGLDVSWYDDAVRRELILGIDAEGSREAVSMCESLRGEDRRALALVALARRRGAESARKILFESLLSARRITAPDMRLCVLSRIGEGFYEAGDPATALRVFEEAQPLVAQLPNKEWPGYARACYATETAVVDLEPALKIIAGMNKSEHDRHHANIAHELAAKNPEASEKVMNMLTPWSLGRAAARVCLRMATTDPERARRIADSVQDSGPRAVALAAMAVPLRSEKLIDAALAALDGPPGSESIVASAGEVLHFVAEAAPHRLDGFLGRLVAMRMPRGDEPQSGWRRALEDDCILAKHIALHDVDLAREVLAEAIDARAYLLSDRRKYDPKQFFLALTLVEPHLAVQVVEDIAPDHPQKSFLLRPRLRQTIAKTLACRTLEQLRARIASTDLEEDQ